jgi:hypothetical protein
VRAGARWEMKLDANGKDLFQKALQLSNQILLTEVSKGNNPYYK